MIAPYRAALLAAVLLWPDASRAQSRSVHLDGIDQYIHLSDYLRLSAAGSTIAFWYRADVLYGPAYALASHSYLPGHVCQVAPPDVSLTIDDETLVFALPAPHALGIWTHLVVSRDAGNTRVFVDGVQAPTGPLASVGEWVLTHFGKYCNRVGTSALAFVGNIDSVATWSVGLSPAAIADLYAADAGHDLQQATGAYAGAALTHWWRMGDGPENGAGWTIWDTVGSLHAFLINMDPTTDYEDVAAP